MTKVTKFDNYDAATVLHFLVKYDHVARRPCYPAFAWRVLSSRFRRLATAHDDNAVLAAVADDCWQRAELAEWRDPQRRRWAWGFAPLAVTAIVVAAPLMPEPPAQPADRTTFN